MNIDQQHKHSLWQYPWRFQEGFLLTAAFAFTGFGLELSQGQISLPLPSSPYSLYICLGLILFPCTLYFSFKKHPITQWLASPPAALSAISYMLIMVILMGLFLQDRAQNATWTSRLALNDITRSWPFLFAFLYLIITLSFVTLKRSLPFKKKNISFMLTHIGLWIILVTAGAGSGDISRWQMKVKEGHVALQAKDEKGHIRDMPFKIHLKDFAIDEYHPKMTLLKSKSSEIIKTPGQYIFSLDKKLKVKLLDYQIIVEDYLPYAAFFNKRFVPVYEEGATPAALVTIKKDGKDISHGWLSAGTYLQPAFVLPLSEELELAMTLPEVKRYHSDIEITDSTGKVISTSLEVNKAIRVDGWKIYQLDYDKDMGRWSRYSIFELVYDPWQSYVYLGIFMTLFGTLSMMWQGTFPNDNKTSKGAQL